MIKLTKIKINPNASEHIHASSVEEYRANQDRPMWDEFLIEGKSPPVDYWLIGEPLSKLVVGNCFMVDRYNRNGVLKRGTFMTSVVEKIQEEDGVTYITTANSLYKMEKVDDEEILSHE